MRHMIVRVLTMTLVALGGGQTLAQEDPATALQNPELQNARALLQAGREQIVRELREDLQMTEEESAGFWPIYAAYIEALSPVRERKALLIARFLSAYRHGEFDAAFAEWLIDENFAIKRQWVATQQEFVPKFRDVLPVVKVARFFQLENKMDAEVDAQLAMVIPLVE